jgi:SAM-dependent methyltransferase
MQPSHYDTDYFAWQKPIGEFGGWANLPKFEPYIRETDTVLEYGCGGGFLLKNIKCARRLGVEINPTARETAISNGIEVYECASQAPEADVVISNHALEHARHPLTELITMRDRLKLGGKAVFVVPFDGITGKYAPNDINYHLYTWNPMTFGNLFTEAGFKVIHSKALLHRWPPMYRAIAAILGRSGFELACRIYGRLSNSLAQVHLVAEHHSTP